MTESEASPSSSALEYHNDADTLKRSLEECLDNIKSAGSFATFGVLAEATSPGLSVPNVGSIALPLQEGQAKAIIGACHRAPFGQGSRTVVDESVRKTWQLNPDQFELRNPKWPSVIRNLTERVVRELGCVGPASVFAQLYKMLLYEKGAMFKPHKDTEKAPGMFGTLVICLPSEYEGGAVVASHRGESKVFEAASAFDHSYIAWYADVTHEVKTVTSGHRLVLTYNLINLSPGPPGSAAMLSEEKTTLKGIISAWTRNIEEPASEAPNFLAYKLDHEYTHGSLRFQSLKGLDRVRAECLREVCAGANACFYLASMERTVMGPCEEEESGYSHRQRHQTQEMHTLEDVLEESIELKRMIDLDGSVLAREIHIEETDIVQEDSFDREPDEEDFEGYTGNAGASATQFYHDTVAILVPFGSLARFLSKHVQQGIVDTNAWYERLLEKVQENPNDEARRQELYHLAVLISQTRSRPQTYQSKQAQRRNYPRRKNFSPAPKAQWPIEASILLKDQALFEMAIESTEPWSTFTHIGMGMFLFDLPTTHAKINRLISRLSSFHGQYRAFLEIISGYESLMTEKAQSDDAKIRQIKAWADMIYTHKLQNVDTLDREDGLDLADLFSTQAERNSLNKYLRLAKSRTNFTAFSVAFATRLLRGTDPERVLPRVDDAPDVCLELYTGFLPTFSVECGSTAKRGRSETDNSPSPVQCLVSADDVAAFLVLLDGTILDPEIPKLITKLEAEAGIVDVVAFESFFLPLLEALTATVPWSCDRVTRYMKLFRTTLLMFARRFVQIEPEAGNWTKTPRGCGCSNCHRLDRFLVNASQQSTRFPVRKSERQHLHQILDRTNISHVTDRLGVEALVVTKPATTSLVKHEQWQKRFAVAEDKINKLDRDILKQLLGEDYAYLTELRATRRGRERLPSARVGVERQGVEIIDLE